MPHNSGSVLSNRWCNSIGGVMISVLASSAVDRSFEPRSGRTKDYEIDICCSSAKREEKTGWLGIRIMCLSGATCLSADCCFSELALTVLVLYKADLIIISLNISLFSSWYSWQKWWVDVKQQSLTHSNRWFELSNR